VTTTTVQSERGPDFKNLTTEHGYAPDNANHSVGIVG
jgi:hypothetical protein